MRYDDDEFDRRFIYIYSLRKSIHYALGGTGKIIFALEKLMNEIGIKIIKNDEVIRIIDSQKLRF